MKWTEELYKEYIADNTLEEEKCEIEKLNAYPNITTDESYICTHCNNKIIEIDDKFLGEDNENVYFRDYTTGNVEVWQYDAPEQNHMNVT